jgi:hypothetical protein
MCSTISAASEKYDDAVDNYMSVHGCYIPILDPTREIPLLTANIGSATKPDTILDPRVHVNFFKGAPVFACTDFHWISRDYFLRLMQEPTGIANKTRFYLYLPHKHPQKARWLWCSLESVETKSSGSTPSGAKGGTTAAQRDIVGQTSVIENCVGAIRSGYGEPVSPTSWEIRILSRESHVTGWSRWMTKMSSKTGFGAICSTNNPSATLQDSISICMKTKMTDLSKTTSLGTLVVVWPTSVTLSDTHPFNNTKKTERDDNSSDRDSDSTYV